MEATDRPATLELSLDKEIVFARPCPSAISYAKSIAAFNAQQIEQLSVPAIEAIVQQTPYRQAFHWTENLIVSPTALGHKIIINADDIQQPYQHTIDGLVLVNMGQGLGHGVMTAGAIAKDTIITHYAGIITQNNSDKPEYKDILSSYRMEYSGYCIDARETSNISAFFLDAPTDIQLKDDYIINPTVIQSIATANTEFVRNIFEGHQQVFLKATRDIQAGELLLVNYGATYWGAEFLLRNNLRLLLTKQGELVPSFAYQYIGGKIKLKYDAANYVEVSYAALIKAYQNQQRLYYEFSLNKQRKMVRVLSYDDLKLIQQQTLHTSVVDPQQLPLKHALIERLAKEYKFQQLLWPQQMIYHHAFYSKALAMLKDNQTEQDRAQATAFLLQALLLAIKEASAAQVLAAIYFDLGNAYAEKAYKEQSIDYMQAAVYLIKESIKRGKTTEKKQRLCEYKSWLRKHATMAYYWRDYCANFVLYLQTL